MRKIIAAIALGLLIAPLALAQTAPAEVTGCKMRHTFGTDFVGFTCPATGSTCDFTSTTNTCGACCLLDTIYTVTDWIFYIVIAVALIFIILGAFSIITAGGSPEKVQSGRNYIVYAVIGLLVGLAAKAIPSIARAILGV
jgi:hypothetical protein